MNLRPHTAFPLILAIFSMALRGLAPAQEADLDVGKIVADALKDAKTPPAEPARSSEANAPGGNPSAANAPAAPRSAADQAAAEAIRGDLAEIDAATQLWAREKKKPSKTKVTLKEIAPYLGPDSSVAGAGGTDRAGNPIDFGTVEDGPRVSSATAKALGQPDEFWGEFAPVISKKELAAMTLVDLKQIRLAVLSWDAENADAAGKPVTFDVLKTYLAPDSEVLKMEGNGRLGNEFVLGTPKDPVRISAETLKELGMPREYWGEFAPKTTTSSKTASRRSSRPPERSFGRKVKDFFKGR
jgi:hypothetical protein